MREQKSKARLHEHGNGQKKDGKWSDGSAHDHGNGQEKEGKRSDGSAHVHVGATIGGKMDYHIMRCTSVLQLLWVVAVTPRHWFFDQASGRPRVRPMLVDYLLPPPFARLAVLLETAAVWTYVVSLLVLFVIPWSSPIFAKKKPTVSALVAATIVSYAFLVMFDVDRVHAPVQCGLFLLFIGSLCDGKEGMMAARIVTSGTWLWAGLHKINPHFLIGYSVIADPILSMALGSDFVSRHRILLHLLAALTEAGVGLVLLLASGALMSPSRLGSAGVIMVRVSVVFVVSMHALIIPQLVSSGWEINVLAWNVQYLFMAMQLWRPWWHSKRDHLTTEKRHGSGKVVAASIAVFVLIPALLLFGLIDPYLGICLYTDNAPILIMELPAGGAPPSLMTSLYSQWGFLDEPAGFNTPLIPAMTHDGRKVYRRWYTLLHSAATGGDGGYPAQWAFMRIASEVCEQVRAADPYIIDDTRFILDHSYTGRTLARSLLAMMSLGPPLPPSPPLMRQGCHAESDDDWRPLHLPTRVDASGIIVWDEARQVEISVTESSALETPVRVYWVGPVGAETTVSELVYVGEVGGSEEPLQVNAWVGEYLLATQGSNIGYVPHNGDPGDLCALDVWLITHDVSQSFILDVNQSSIDRRAVRGLHPCQHPRSVEFVNVAGGIIDIIWVPHDDRTPMTIEVGLTPGDMRSINTWDGERFRAVSRDGASCSGEKDFVVNATHPRFFRHYFCEGLGALPSDNMGTPPVEWVDRSRYEL